MLGHVSTFAQQKYYLEIKPLHQDDAKNVSSDISYSKEFTNEQQRHRELQQYLLQLYDNGFLAATIDSTQLDSNRLIAFLDQGTVYKWARLGRGNVDEGVLSKVGFRDKLYANKIFSHKDVLKLHEKLISFYENNGYPFASVRLDSLEIIQDEGNTIRAQLNLSKNTEYRLDSVLIKGSANIAPIYIYNYLGIKPGDLYSELQISKISARIKELRFLKETKPVQIVFAEKNAKVVLHLKSRKASRFDGMAGFLPNSESTGKLLITGEARLHLINSFGRGELIGIQWRSLQPRTQDLKARFTYPFVLSTPFGADIKFNLYKRDTIFLDLITDIGIQYLLKGGDFLRAFVKNKETRLLSGYTAALPYAGVKTTLYGLGYKTQRLDYAINPRKGYAMMVNAAIGNKKIKNDPDLNPDTVEVKSTEINIDADIDFYIPVANRMVINIGASGAYLNSKSMFQNELFRIGGMATLRGFDEESINTSVYAIYNIEYRYLLEQNSYLYLFFNGAYYENEVNRSKNESWVDTPFGYGAGISFETRAGIFSINYALGQQKGNPVDFRSAKVHFGIVNRF